MALNPDQYAAYFQGQRGMHGIDPEVAEDLGYATTPERVEEQVAAAQRVAEILDRMRPVTEVVPLPRGVDGREASRLIANATNPYRRPSPEERAATTAHVEAVKAHIMPLRGSK